MPNPDSAPMIALSTTANPGVMPPLLPPRMPKGRVRRGHFANFGLKERQAVGSRQWGTRLGSLGPLARKWDQRFESAFLQR
jgi:hypothetical protein